MTFMVPSSPPSRSRSNTFGATAKITERAMPCQEQQPPNFDGIAEIWFDDISGVKAFLASDGYRQNVIPDEEAFMDRKRCELLFTHEHSVMA
ncbi:MAG: EthD domain-containing protein [Acetobacteraceae bacterium]